MAQSNQSSLMNKHLDKEPIQNKRSEGVVHLNKHQEEKQTSESSAFEQVMMQMNIADRTSFDKKYMEMWNEASENDEMLSLMICEIDFFKAYNDNYGHQGASFMLLVIALALKTTCEEYDCFLGRYKGDEFGILLKGGDEHSANEVAEKLRAAVEKSRTEHKFSDVSDIVTLSVGLSSFYPTSAKVVMNQASSALVDAKSSGRNKVVGHIGQEQTSQTVINSTIANNIDNKSVEIVTEKSTTSTTSVEKESVLVQNQKENEALLNKETDLQKEEFKQEKLETTESTQEKQNGKKGFLGKVPFYRRSANKKDLTKEEKKALKEEQRLAEEEERRKEEEFLRQQEEEDRRKKNELGAFDMDPFF